MGWGLTQEDGSFVPLVQVLRRVRLWSLIVNVLLKATFSLGLFRGQWIVFRSPQVKNECIQCPAQFQLGSEPIACWFLF